MAKIKWETRSPAVPRALSKKARAAATWVNPKQKSVVKQRPQLKPINTEDVVESYVNQDNIAAIQVLHEVYCQNMVAGTLWVTRRALSTAERDPSKRASYPVLRLSHSEPGEYGVGQTCVYVGMVEIKQRNHKGTVINIRKHAFMFSDGIYIPRLLSYVMPMSEWEKKCDQNTG